MKLTKYQHSFFILEEGNKKLIVDPGIFSTLSDNLENSVAIVITHSHPDHFSPENIERIRSVNPDIKIFTPNDISDLVYGTIQPSDTTVTIGPFSIDFYNQSHEFIRKNLALPQNLCLSINNILTYPGDSYSLPKEPTKFLLAPIAAPWARMKETEEFIISSKAEIVIPTHDAILSDNGFFVYDTHLQAICDNNDKQYVRLKTGESLSLE